MGYGIILRTANFNCDFVERSRSCVCSPKKMMSLESFDIYLSIVMVFGQYLALQLRAASLKTNSGQQGCLLRPCILFHCSSE